MPENITIDLIEKLEEITKDDEIKKLKKLLQVADQKAGAAEKKADKATRSTAESNKLLERAKSQVAEQRKKNKTLQSAYNQLKQTSDQNKQKLDAALKTIEEFEAAEKSDDE
ncbi:hypothetical protein [Alkalimarinus alittae]|uniref:Uncharacterized protein n=1 Tax=Alkalimarinus alittae TaxID=2961619 RepID=A0ABY6N461_9ALTE|nr:hypothetical protein [Alkalimarinus alittae]UZE96912.1 hypothetical protein NKI27_03940 [Alkalimarinus alittae]